MPESETMGALQAKYDELLHRCDSFADRAEDLAVEWWKTNCDIMNGERHGTDIYERYLMIGEFDFFVNDNASRLATVWDDFYAIMDQFESVMSREAKKPVENWYIAKRYDLETVWARTDYNGETV